MAVGSKKPAPPPGMTLPQAIHAAGCLVEGSIQKFMPGGEWDNSDIIGRLSEPERKLVAETVKARLARAGGVPRGG